MKGAEILQSLKNKTLIYFCVFHKKEYKELLQILLSSLILRSDLKNIDLLVLTSEDLKSEIQGVANAVDVHLDIFTMEFTQLHEALCARISIFTYPLLMLYKQVLYLDTDIVVQGDINQLLNVELEEKVYAFREGNIGHHYWGGSFFNFSMFDRNEPGFNSGVLLFKPTIAIRNVFNDIQEHIVKILEAGKKLPDCPDQSLLNYHCIKNGLANVKFMETLVKFYSRYDDVNTIVPDTILCHFTWPIGDPRNKKNRMIRFYSNFLKNYIDKTTYPNMELIGLTYSWSGYGFFRMEPNLLVTKWTNGTYKWINSHVVYLVWNGMGHILRFNDNYTRFLSVRISDMENIRGYKFFIRNKRISNRKVVILLTATVNVGKKETLFQVNPIDRIKTYLKSIRSWLNKTDLKIVVIENSGYEFKELAPEIEKFKGSFEIISYNENTLPESAHLKNNCDKGSSELFSINYARNHSKLIAECEFLIKITARYFIEELENYLAKYNLDTYDAICQNNIQVTPRCELIGCNMKNFNILFKQPLNNTAFKMVEIHYRDRLFPMENILECKQFQIEPTQRGGINALYVNI